MAQEKSLVAEYQARLPAETLEQRFLRSIPWVIDVGPQDPESLIRELREEAPRLAELPRKPVFSLLTPLYNTPPRLLQELILSVRCQSWPYWELLLVDDGSPERDHLEVAREWANRDPRIKLYECAENRGISGARNFAIEHSTGDFFAILDHDDLLHPMALGQFARVLNDEPKTNLLFSNECQIDDEGTRTYGYFYKPHFDLFTLLRANYVCHFTAIGRDLLMESRRDGRVFRTEYDGAEDHDLFARVAMTGSMIARHVPLFLYYWRAVPTSCSMSMDAKPEIPEKRLIMLDELLPEVYPGATFRASSPDCLRGECHLSIRLKSVPRESPPSLLVVVPFKDSTGRLLKTLESLEKQRHALDVSVILIEADSEEMGTAEVVADWLARPRVNRYKHVKAEGPLHFAKLVNRAVSEHGTACDLVLTLRQDIHLRSPELIQTLAMQLLADPVAGVVGVRIVERDGRSVRHAGLKVHADITGSGYHNVGPAWQSRDFVHDDHVILGVTLACAMTRRETFEQLGGHDEVILTSSQLDLDFCCKAIEHGYRNYYFGTLTAAAQTQRDEENSCTSAFELAVLHERHAAALASWRVRMMVHVVDPIWPLEPDENAALAFADLAPVPKPARYKVADALHAGLKRILGPIYTPLRRIVAGSWKTAKKLRGRRKTEIVATSTSESIYRPNLTPKRSRAARR